MAKRTKIRPHAPHTGNGRCCGSLQPEQGSSDRHDDECLYIGEARGLGTSPTIHAPVSSLLLFFGRFDVRISGKVSRQQRDGGIGTNTESWINKERKKGVRGILYRGRGLAALMVTSKSAQGVQLTVETQGGGWTCSWLADPPLPPPPPPKYNTK